MKYYTDKYNDLINELTHELKVLILTEGVESEHIQTNCLPIDIDGDQHFTELVFLNDEVTLLNQDGNHYSLSQLGEGDEFFLRIDAIIGNYS